MRSETHPDAYANIDSDDLIDLVSDRAAIDSFRAEAVTTAVLRALAERMGREPLRPVTAQLPRRLQVATRAAGTPRDMSLCDFLRRVCELAMVQPHGVKRDVRAVFSVLDDATSGDRLEDIADRLPAEYETLFAA